MPRFVVLLRAITNLPMKPFRDAMEDLGFTEVESYGTSGNLLFNAAAADTSSLERRIATRFKTEAFVRTRSDLARVVAHDPLDSIIMFLARAPTPTRRRSFFALEFQPPAPILRGRALYFSFPLLLRGKRTPFDIERALGVKGTFRTARVVATLLSRMSEQAVSVGTDAVSERSTRTRLQGQL